MTNALTIRTRREPGCVVVTVAGEVDIATVARLRARLSALAAGGVPLVADLDPVSFIDATGLGALAGAARGAAPPGASLYAGAPPAPARRPVRGARPGDDGPPARGLAAGRSPREPPRP